MVRVNFTWTALWALVAAFVWTGTAHAGTLRVGHDYWIGYAGVFIAEAKGFFNEEGVDVQLQSFAGPGDSLPPLIAGHLDLNLTTLHNLALVAGTQGGPPLAVVYLIDASHGADAIVARPSIKSVEELRGKRIAVTFNEANHLFLLVALERVGLTEADVTLMNVSADDAGAAFLAGAVDAAVTWEPWVSRAKAGEGHVIFSTADAPDLIINAVVAPLATRQAKRDEIAAFLRAIDRGVAFLESNPQESKQILAEKLEATPDDVAEMLAGDRIYDLNTNREMLGAESIRQTMASIIAFLTERDLLNRPADPESLFDGSFVHDEQ
jgi:NitT/TauT family transport system substrate-binding protein